MVTRVGGLKWLNMNVQVRALKFKERVLDHFHLLLRSCLTEACIDGTHKKTLVFYFSPNTARCQAVLQIRHLTLALHSHVQMGLRFKLTGYDH